MTQRQAEDAYALLRIQSQRREGREEWGASVFLQVQIIREGFLEEAAFDADLAKRYSTWIP